MICIHDVLLMFSVSVHLLHERQVDLKLLESCYSKMYQISSCI